MCGARRCNAHPDASLRRCPTAGYYQAIETAIELGLQRAEAGAQGDHKIARGYLPTLTHSSHYLRDATFHQTIADLLDREREQTLRMHASIGTRQNPFAEAAAARRDTQKEKLP